MKIPLVALITLVPSLYAANSLAELMRGMPLEIRDQIFQSLNLEDLVNFYTALDEKHKDILPTDRIKMKAILEKAEICGQPLPEDDSDDYMIMIKQNFIDCEELSVAIKTFFLKSADPNDVSSFENFLLQLSPAEDDMIFVGVAKAIVQLPELINALGHLSADIYANIMPPLLKIIEDEETTFSLDHVITDQLILDNPSIFPRSSKHKSRIENFVNDILTSDNVGACQVLISNPDSRYILSELENKIRRGLGHKAAIYIFSHKIRQSNLKGNNLINFTLATCNERPDIFVELFEDIKHLTSFSTPRDVLLKAIELGWSNHVTMLLKSEEISLLVDHEVVLMAWGSLLENGSIHTTTLKRLYLYTFFSNSAFLDIFNSIIEKAKMNGVDFSFSENILLAEATKHNYIPLIEMLIRDPKVRAVGLTQNMKDGGDYYITPNTIDLILKAFGISSDELNELVGNTVD